MIVKEFDYVKGNTVVKPNRRISESDKKYKELERSKRNKQKREYLEIIKFIRCRKN